jgi:hypothetical protein
MRHPKSYVYPQITQITQIKKRKIKHSNSVVRFNLRNLRNLWISPVSSRLNISLTF